MSFVLDNIDSNFIDYTHIINYTDNKPPMRVAKAGRHRIVLPRGVCVMHTSKGIIISCRALQAVFGGIKQRTYRANNHNLIDKYIQVMKDLSRVWAYVNANHAKLIHTQNQRLSKSTQAYVALDIEPIRGVVIFQANGSYFISVEVAGRNHNQRVGLIDDPDIRNKAIHKIYSSILLRGVAWIENSIGAQSFLKKYIMT